MKQSHKEPSGKLRQADAQLAQAVRRSRNGSEGSGGQAAAFQEEARRKSRSKHAELIEGGGDNRAYHGQMPDGEPASSSYMPGEANPKAALYDHQYSSE